MSDLLRKSQFLIYQAENGAIKIDVRFEGDTVWLTQPSLAELFQTTVPNISMHLRNIYEEGELSAETTLKEFLTVRQEGSRRVSRNLEYYNLDAIISVGYWQQRLTDAATQPDDFEKSLKTLPTAEPRDRKKRGAGA